MPRQTKQHWLTRCGRSLVVLTLLLAGCDFPGRPNPADRPVEGNQIVDFDHLFQKNCAGCHGANGTLGPAPPLNDAIFLNIVSDTELERLITEGRPGTLMIAWDRDRGGPLASKQVKALATGLKSHWKSPVKVDVPLPPYLPADRDANNDSTERLAGGAKAFARACAVCHGNQGQGTDSAGAIHDPAFLGLISNQALRRIIITGRPDLGMPNFADGEPRGDDYQPLSSAEIDDLVALLSSWRKGSPSIENAAKKLSANEQSTSDEGKKP